MADEDHVGGRRLVRLEPAAEIVSGYLDGLVRLVAEVYLGMNHMALGQSSPQVAVDMCRKGAERGVVAHEAVDVDDEQRPPSLRLVVVVCWGLCLGCRRSWVVGFLL